MTREEIEECFRRALASTTPPTQSRMHREPTANRRRDAADKDLASHQLDNSASPSASGICRSRSRSETACSSGSILRGRDGHVTPDIGEGVVDALVNGPVLEADGVLAEAATDPTPARAGVTIDRVVHGAGPRDAAVGAAEGGDPFAQLADQGLADRREGAEIDGGQVRDHPLLAHRPDHLGDRDVGRFAGVEEPAHRQGEEDDPAEADELVEPTDVADDFNCPGGRGKGLGSLARPEEQVPSQPGGGSVQTELRFYGPTEPLLDGSFVYPVVTRMEALTA